MDILAGMLAYVAGIGTLFAGLALSFFVFFSTPNEPLQTQAQPQNASAMLVRPSAPTKAAAVEARAKHSARQETRREARQVAGHFEKHAAVAGPPDRAQPTGSARDLHRKPAASAAQARWLIQEERARRLAYQQGSSSEGRFLGYAD